MSLRNREEFMATAAIHIAATFDKSLKDSNPNDYGQVCKSLAVDAWSLARELADQMPNDIRQSGNRGNTGPR